MILQLNPPIPVEVVGGETPAGKGWALFLLDYSQEHNLVWAVAMNASGEVWCVSNEFVRMQENLTFGRNRPGPMG